MITISVSSFVVRAVYSAFTLYMMLILLRWTASWLQVDLNQRRLRWAVWATDPLISRVRVLLRRFLIPTETIDFAPLAALLTVWLARTLALSVVAAVM